VRDGVLIATWHTSANFGSGAVSAIRLFRMRTSDRAVLTDETFGADGVFYYFPAVTVDSLGTIFVGFDRSSATEFPSAYATGKRRTDATLQPSALLKAGISATNQSRWGDFTGIDLDASLCGPGGSSAWYAGQWTKALNTFGTWINKLSFGYGQVAGTVLDDCDGNAATSADRAGLAGVTLTLKQRVTTLATTLSSATGSYDFGYLETGTYDVLVSPPPGGAAVGAIPGAGGTTQTRVSATDVQVNLTNAQTSVANDFLVTTTHPAPSAAGLVPATKNAGDAGFALTVNGANFTRCAVVRLDGSDRVTSWVSVNQLTATIPASDLTTAGTRAITVFNPAPGGGISSAQTLTVAAADAIAPVVTVLHPNDGELLLVGTTESLTWNASDNTGVTSVDLLLSRTGAAGTFDPIASGIANTGTYDWSVTGPATTTGVLKAVAYDAATNSASDLSDAGFVIATSTTDVGSGPVTAVALSPVSPNPVRNDGAFQFALPATGPVRLSILDVQGRELGVLAEGTYDAGTHRASLGGAVARGALTPGLYFARLRVANRTVVRRFVVVR
jgi:hypothetical protein